MKKRLFFSMAVIGLVLCNFNTPLFAANTDLIPAIKSSLYYKIGGGDDVPLPAFYDTSYIPLNVEGNIGIGFNCGAFNPVASIRNSLNEIKDSVMNVKRQVLNDATAAVTEFPLYELSRADPNLYNLLTNAIADARDDIAVSTKSCQVMQSEIASGENPYAHWGQISLGQKWQQNIGTAELSGNGDINQASHDVANDSGKSGVPWVDPDNINSGGTYYAGGENQPSIHVIHDSATAAYQVIQQGGAAKHDMPAGFTENNSELNKIFPNAKAAADWITQVVGDESITTYNNGQKSSQPGSGLYSAIQQQTEQVLPKLQALVDGSTPLTVTNLLAVSPEGMALSKDVIDDIRNQTKVVQHIIVNKLAQNIAAMIVINKARLAMQILQTGSRIPAIYSNKAAQHTINNSITQLQKDINDILLFVKARQTLMSSMLTTIVQAGENKKLQNTVVAASPANAAILENGAVKNMSEKSS